MNDSKKTVVEYIDKNNEKEYEIIKNYLTFDSTLAQSI